MRRAVYLFRHCCDQDEMSQISCYDIFSAVNRCGPGLAHLREGIRSGATGAARALLPRARVCQSENANVSEAVPGFRPVALPPSMIARQAQGKKTTACAQLPTARWWAPF